MEEVEVFDFPGPKGAGKTTIIRTLMALLKANSGTAHRGVELLAAVGGDQKATCPANPRLTPT